MQEVEVRQSSGGSSTTTISLTTPAATRGSRGSSGRDSSELDPTATSSVTSGGSEEAPMDLSSGGGGHGGMHGGVAMPVTPTTLLHNASLARFEDHPLLNARKLAEFVKAQHLVQQQRANETTPPSVADSLHCDMQMRMHPKKRPWPSTPLSLASEKEVSAAAEVVRQKSLIPLDLIRAKFELHGGERSSPDSAEGGSSSNASTPSLNSNPVVGSNNNNGAMNGNGSSSGREVKKRRLDELLSKKFAMADSPPSASNSPSPKPVVLQSVGSPVFHHEGKGGSSRRKSSEHQPRKANRRKQPHPQSPPTGLTIRPSADLFPQQRPITPPPPPAARPLKPLAIPKSEVDNEALKGQILQLQLAQAALLSNPSDLLKSALGGASAAGQQPMLIYGYYAQILQSIQSQQHKLVEELASKQRSSPTVATSSPRLTDNFKFPPTAESILREPSRNPGLLPPFSLSAFSPRSGLHSPLGGSATPLLSPAHLHGQNRGRSRLSSPSPAGIGADGEPRRRAPRALTGRHVRSGTGASPTTLEILRRKILERMKLKELLGENSHLYFGALNKQKGNKNGAGLFPRKK